MRVPNASLLKSLAMGKSAGGFLGWAESTVGPLSWPAQAPTSASGCLFVNWSRCTHKNEEKLHALTGLFSAAGCDCELQSFPGPYMH